MATRSSISIRNEDGSYTGIYCHWDGYLSNNGRILLEHYNSEERIRELLALGDISVLAPEIGEKHPFDTPYSIFGEHAEANYKNWCKAYGRDRGDSDCEARNYPTVSRLLDVLSQEYDYLWYDNQWHVRCHLTGDRFVPVVEQMRVEDPDFSEEE
jgi:hypothetical protein